MQKFHSFLIVLIIFSIGLAVGNSYFKAGFISPAPFTKNTHEAFILEVYDKVKENYWDNISDTQILDIFKAGFTKSGGSTYKEKFKDKNELLNAFKNTISDLDENKKNKFTADLATAVLNSLNPIGRSGLFTTKQEEQLKNTVENIDPQKDLYKNLGLNKGASESAILQAYEKKSKELENDTSKEAETKRQEIAYAKSVLTQKDQKTNYDQKGIEPTFFTKIISSSILYFQFKKFSPTSYDEFLKSFESYKNNSSLTSLIFDLRGNVGGAIDATPYFLGNFIGKGISAFDFYHKDEYLPFKTPTEKLPSITKYKQIVILVDNNTQSSAELMATTFKKYRTGVVLGVPTKGWGTVEKVFPLDNQFDKSQKYSLFLVHSITLRDDNLPIEGRGVDPDINIKNIDWEQQLFNYFRNQELIDAIRAIN